MAPAYKSGHFSTFLHQLQTPFGNLTRSCLYLYWPNQPGMPSSLWGHLMKNFYPSFKCHTIECFPWHLPDKTALLLSHHPYSVLFFLITHHLLHSSLFSACIQPQNSKKMVRYVFGCSVIFVELMEFNPSDAIQIHLFFKRHK